MARRRPRVDNICPFCKKRTFDPPEGMKSYGEEYQRYYRTEVQSVETKTKITLFHRTCYLNQIRNGGSSLG